MSVSKALSDAKQGISLSLRAVQNLSSDHTTSSLPPLIPGLPESFAQLLTKLHHDTTALSLSFKPPITQPAAIAQLEKVKDDVGRLSACVVAASGGQRTYNSALVEEWKDGVEAIASETLRLLEVFEGVEKAEKEGKAVASGSKDENPYLLHTGLVWEAIDRLSGNLSVNEVGAVEKRWRAQGEVMKDAWTEFKEFLEDAEIDEDDAPDEDEDEDEDDAGLDDDDDDFKELEGMMNGKMSPEERARAESAKPLLGLHQILYSTIPRYLPLLILEPEEAYTELLQLGSDTTAAFDTAIGAMYPSQDVDEIEESLSQLSETSKTMVQCVKNRLERVKQGEDGDKREGCRSFLGKWVDRLEKEQKEWDEKLSLASLGHALPK